MIPKEVMMRQPSIVNDTSSELSGNFRRARWSVAAVQPYPSKFVLVILGLCSLLPAVAHAEAAASPGAIEGRVTDGGRPVAGALVAAIPFGSTTQEIAARTVSDASGHFRLSGLKPHTYGVTATATGHTGGLNINIKVAAGAAQHADVAMGGDGYLVSGRIVDATTGQPIDKATLFAGRVSDVDGDAFLSDVAGGKFAVRLPRAGYTLYALVPNRPTAYRQIPPGAPADPVILPVERGWPAGPAPAAVVDWVRTHAVPLSTVEAGHGFADLAPLAPIIGDARVVGLGEATHGTREFFQLKHRLLEWLVAERGFTQFAIEASMPECEDLNQFVLTGKGDPQKLLAGVYFWTWNTEEVLALVQWMRKWNENPKHPRVQFYGFDMQYPALASKRALAYVARVAPGEVAALSAPIVGLTNPLDNDDLPMAPPAAKKAALDGAHALVRRFDAARAEWSARTSDKEWALARQHARIAEQFAESLVAPDGGRLVRDQAMAENIAWILEREPNAKMVAWAQNFHIGRDHIGGAATMGGELGRRLKHQYVNVGFVFDQGGFRARDADAEGLLRAFTLPPAPEGSLDHTLAESKLPRFILDLRARPQTGVVGDWWAAAHAHRDMGAMFSTHWPAAVGEDFVFPRTFDLIAFVGATTAARPLPMFRDPDRVLLPQARNLGFEAVDGARPRDWAISPRLAAFGWAVEASKDHPFAGSRSVVVRALPGPHAGETYGRFQQTVSAEPYRGKHVRLSAAIRTKVPAGAGARLMMEDDRDGRDSGHAIAGADWKRYTVEIDVAPTASSLTVGGALAGGGQAWFDDFQLEVVTPAPQEHAKN